jgi:hypothetical protein
VQYHGAQRFLLVMIRHVIRRRSLGVIRGKSTNTFAVCRLAFAGWRSTFTIWRSPFNVGRSPFAVRSLAALGPFRFALFLKKQRTS